MQLLDMREVPAGTVLETDLAIVGTGPAGLILANEFIGSRTRIILLESGGLEETDHVAQRELFESIGEPRIMDPRKVRNRVLGGSSHTWAGKCRTFDDIDYEKRPWVPHSGWPIASHVMRDYEARAASLMHLGPNIYDSRLWRMLGQSGPRDFSPGILESCFWQYSRDPHRPLDFLRFGPHFTRQEAANIRVFYNATVTQVELEEGGHQLASLQVTAAPGIRLKIVPRVAVLAGGGIENARLLLASNKLCPKGVGNENGLVGRFLMDHPRTSIGHYPAGTAQAIRERFGLFSLKHQGKIHFYTHGFALSPIPQRQKRLLNCAAYLSEHRAEDDPWDALKRLAQRQLDQPLKDMGTALSHPGLLLKGLYSRAVLGRNVDHKLDRLAIDCLVEQVPDPDSRITLASRKDEFGMPLPRIDWKISDLERRTVAELAMAFSKEMMRAGIQPPEEPQWLADGALDAIPFSDMAHPIGTTRMADSPKAGVVDPDCRVHGLEGLFIAGTSVFPSASHVNPTLMVAAMSVRLADRLKSRFLTDRTRETRSVRKEPSGVDATIDAR